LRRLPSCSAFGDTQQEALTELQDAIIAWIEVARSAGNAVPVPSDLAKDAGRGGIIRYLAPAL
jgi:predicted RNase H-like HicB family nuclease